MEWILLEAGLALGLAVFIVWFTAGARRKPPTPAKSTESTESTEAIGAVEAPESTGAKDRGR